MTSGARGRSDQAGGRPLRAAVATAALLVSLLVPSSAAAIEDEGVIPVVGAAQARTYTVAENGDIWVARATNSNWTAGTIQNLGPDGDQNLETINTSGYFYPIGMAVWADRVYVNLASSGVASYRMGIGGDNPGFVINDSSTRNRFDATGRIRILGSGNGTAGIVGERKVSLADFSNVNAAHPFYSQSIYGANINSGFDSQIAYWEGCIVGPPAPDGPSGGPETCGRNDGSGGVGSPSDPTRLDAPADMASGPNDTIYITEGLSDSVSMIFVPPGGAGYTPEVVVSSSGTGTGQLDSPESIVRDPASGHLLVSDANRRISEYTTGGAFIRSFGMGVRTGAYEFEACGPGIGECRQGLVQYGRLDIGSDGDLLADMTYRTTDNALYLGIQRIDLDAGPEPQPQSVALKAPKKVKKGRKATLTATAKPCPGQTEKVRFESGVGGQWSRLAPPKAVGATCRAKLAQVVRSRSQFRAVALDGGGNVLARSPAVSVGVR